MLTEAGDFRDECAALYEALRDVPAERWVQPTQFKRWTYEDIVGHLTLFDHAARLTIESEARARAFFRDIRAHLDAGETLVAFTRRWTEGARGRALLERWIASARELADRYAAEDPQRRVVWGGPSMSVRSCLSARQMETWAHGQAVFDSLGRERIETDRLKNIAVIGINTFAWSFANRGLTVPPQRPNVRLTAPSGALWEWSSRGGEDVIEGPAVDFCRVVAQTRNLADTTLAVSGAVARQWMSIAQCFAGPPQPPPASGTRHIESRTSAAELTGAEHVRAKPDRL